jgi:predicted nucleotidyltransferase
VCSSHNTRRRHRHTHTIQRELLDWLKVKMNSQSDLERSDLTSSVEEMMFGFGDAWPPDLEAVKLVENLVEKYIENLAIRAQNVAAISGKLDKECFLYLVRQDTAKFTRVQKLLKTNEEIKKIREIDKSEEPC